MISVVTDSGAGLPPALIARHGITVVPLRFTVGGRTYDEGDPEATGTLAEALRRGQSVLTSRPGPEAFARAYAAAARAGATGLVSVHLSGQVSGTCESASMAARGAPLPVRVVDSRSVGMGCGFAALAAAGVPGSDRLDLAAAAAARRAASTRVWFCVDSLEHLRRGGRLRAPATLLGGVLSVKPLLHLVDGRVELLEKVRTSARALSRLEDLVVAGAGELGGAPVELAVQHLDAPSRAGQLSARLQARLGLAGVHSSEVGAALGAHTGPGVVAVVLAPALSP